jgi:DNA-directed RNA polymerase subunit RPC12/RpoP
MLMPSPEMQTSEVTRLRIREFNKLKLGGGTRLLKCEACGGLTDHGVIVDRDIVEEGASGQLEKTGYIRWTLCPDCSGKILEKTNAFSEEILKDIQKIIK